MGAAKRLLLGVVPAVAVLFGAMSASGTTITLVATGKITSVVDSNSVTDGSLVVDASYTATLVYDLAAAFDREPDPALGDWVVPAASSSVTVTVGNYTFDAADPLVLGVENQFFLPNLDAVGWLVLGLSGVGALDSGVTFGTGYTAGTLFDYTGVAVTSDSLASANWNRDDYGADQFAFELFIEVLDPRTTTQDYIEIFGTIDSISVLPEPGTLLLFGAGLVALSLRARR